jgi:spore germination protein GerM
MAVFDSYSSRSGEIFFNEIYKSSKQINSQKTSESILFMCRAKFGTNQLKSMKTPYIYTDISGDFQLQVGR